MYKTIIRIAHNKIWLSKKLSWIIANYSENLSQNSLELQEDKLNPKGSNVSSCRVETFLSSFNERRNHEEAVSLMDLVNELVRNFHYAAVRDYEHFKSQKMQNAELYMPISKIDDFSNFCNMVNKNLQLLDKENLVKLFQALMMLHISEKSIIMQNILQLIAHHMHSYSYHNLFALRRAFAQGGRKIDISTLSPLGQTIYVGLKTQFICKLKIEKFHTNIDELANLLPSIAAYDQDLCLYDIIYHIDRQKSLIDVTDAIKIYKGLCLQSRSHIILTKYRDLLCKTQTILVKYGQELTNTERISILKYATRLKHIEDECLDNLGFVSNLVRQILNSDPTETELMELLNVLRHLAHRNIEAITYIDEYWISNRDKASISYYLLLASLRYFSFADMKPEFLKNVQNILQQLSPLDINQSTVLSLYLLTFEHYYEDFIKQILADYELQINQGKAIDEKSATNLLDLNASLKVFYPNVTVGPSQELQKKAIMHRDSHVQKTSWTDQLDEFAKTHNFIITNLRTKFGHFIDFAVLLNRETGNFAPISNCIRDATTAGFVEDISIAPDDQLILFLSEFPKVNSRLGEYTLRMKCIKALTGCPVYTLRPFRTPINEKELRYKIRKAIGISSIEIKN